MSMILKTHTLVLAALASLAAGAAHAAEEIAPEQWLDCYAASRLRQDVMGPESGYKLQQWMAAGEVRNVYYRLLPFYLAHTQKARGAQVEPFLNKAAEDMRATKSKEQIFELAHTCTVGLPSLNDPKLTAKYPWLSAKTELAKDKWRRRK